MGGPASIAAGLDAWSSPPSVSGLVEVAGHLPRLLRLRSELLHRARRHRPDLAILVDAPDFHLGLARGLRRSGIRTVAYGAPSVWAWRPGRAKAFSAAFDRILVLFRFEVAAWPVGDVHWVGHPAFDDPTPPQPAADRPRLVLLPGSRAAEVGQHLPRMLAAAEKIRCERPELEVALSVAPGLDGRLHRRAVERRGLDVRWLRGAVAKDIGSASACWAASGTVTLRLGLWGVPQAVVYRLHPVTYAVLRRLVRVSHVALPNLLTGTAAVPEFIQARWTTDALVEWTRTALDVPAIREDAVRLAEGLRRAGGAPGSSRRAARAVLDLLGSDGLVL